MDQNNLLAFDLPAVERKKVSAAFDGGMLSSDSGVLLLRGVERRLGLAARLAGCLKDKRDPELIEHTLVEMLRLRMFAIAAGYEDANDCDTLRNDPVFKQSLAASDGAVGHAPASGDALCSTVDRGDPPGPTMSRLENAPSKIAIGRMMVAMIDQFCASYRKAPWSIVLDIDDTLDAVHGHQQLSLFNAHYDERCFLPIHIYEGTSGKPVAMILRAGKTPSGVPFAKLRVRSAHDPQARDRAHPAALAARTHHRARRQSLWPARGDGLVRRQRHQVHLRAQRQRRARRPGPRARRRSVRAPRRERGGQDAHLDRGPLCGEVVAPGAPRRRAHRSDGQGARHPLHRHHARRLAQASLPAGPPGRERLYCERGNAENFIKLHKSQLASDRTSCRSPLANQFRIILHTGAYWLLYTLRAAAPKRSELARAEFTTLRLRLIKIAARVVEGAARIRVWLPTACPDGAMFRMLAARFAVAEP